MRVCACVCEALLSVCWGVCVKGSACVCGWCVDQSTRMHDTLYNMWGCSMFVHWCVNKVIGSAYNIFTVELFM